VDGGGPRAGWAELQPDNDRVRSSTPWWGILSSAAAPVLLIGGWTLAAYRQRHGFDSSAGSISALAALGADDRWIMTTGLAATGVCHVVTAAALGAAARPGRVVLGVGGVATALVAVFPLPVTGGSTTHAILATVAFLALAAWPALGWRRRDSTPPALRPATSVGVAVALLALVAWFGISEYAGERVGLAERVAAGAQTIWPFIVALSTRTPAPAKPPAVAVQD
jgi:hypothetical membrane protein